MAKNSENTVQNTHFPPVVAVLGHVDHGKTSLLDAIRKTSVTAREHGGITQHIGASEIELEVDGKKRKITFLDTPGHEAFGKMRSRGANAADICLLIVSSADGVMPQTKESIQLIQSAGIPYIVVLTKSDLETRNPEKVKRELANEKVILEGMGGDVPVIEVSSKSGHNIKELLDLILLIKDMHQGQIKTEKDPFEAVVIESRLDPKSGVRVSLVIKSGTVSLRDELAGEGANGKVRNILSTLGKPVQSATVGTAVEILGFEKVLPVGSAVMKKSAANDLPKIESEQKPGLKRELVYAPQVKNEGISLILVADTLGSLEAILGALPEDMKIVSKKTGEITEADVLLAKSTGAFVVGFNSKIKPEVIKLSGVEKVLVKNYTIIYEMLDELTDVLEGKKLSLLEQVLGIAKIQASFPFNKEVVLGVKVLEGRVAKGDKVRIERDGESIGTGKVISLRQGKDETSKVVEGNEAGIIISPSLDFQVGDVVVLHN